MKTAIFEAYHPLVAAVYCVAVISVTMAVFQPIFQVLSVVAALCYGVMLRGGSAIAKSLAWYAILVVVMMVLGGMLNSMGTVLLFKIGHRGFYLESTLYGLCMGIMLVSVIQWFSNSSHILTSDRMMQLTGNVIPTIGLMITMVLRLVPQFVRRGSDIRTVQQICTSAQFDEAGSRKKDRGIVERKVDEARSALRDTTVLMGWGMEDSLDTAESMHARGWGAAAKRTTYRRSDFRVRDGIALTVICAIVVVNVAFIVMFCSRFSFYPEITGIADWWCYLPFAVLLALPALLKMKEIMAWSR